LTVPTIGIGAGTDCDAQVLVWTDMAGLTANPPKLAKAYRNIRKELMGAAQEFAEEVRSGKFPTESQTFH
jgi:3-methyl-2-oxobutanoate hydroxymethyltransferase